MTGGVFTPTPGALEKALELLGPLGAEAFVAMCVKRKDRAINPACRKWKLSYEQYYELRRHFAHKIEAGWLAVGYVSSFVSRSQPPEDL